LETTVANQNNIQEEIKSRFRWGSAYYRSVQNLSSARLFLKCKEEILQNYNYPVAFYKCES